MDLGLSGRRAVVTGGSKGLGQAIAAELLAEGAEVVICSRNEAELEATAAELRKPGGTVIAFCCDVTDPDQVAAFVTESASAMGGIDILVNNAGLGWAGPIGDITAEKVAELVAVNLTAPMQLTRLLAPAMMARGRGRVVFVSSIAGATGVRGEAVYSATKAGLASFAESLAYELDGHDVRVSVIVPGVIDTPFFDRRGHPYGRKTPGPQPPERVARAIVSCLERDRDVAYVPRWLRFPAWLHGAAPGAFRVLAARFGDPG